MSRYKDFDDAVAQLEPIRFKVKGRDYEISADPPAGLILQLMREGKLEDPQEAYKVLSVITGEGNLEKMLADGMGLNQLLMLLEWLLVELGFDEKLNAVATANGEGAGNPNPSDLAISSKTGDS